MHFKTLPARVVFAVFFLVFLPAGAVPANNLPAVPAPAVESITPGELRMHLEFLASRELGGRYTLAPNFSIAARYLASRLKADGFRGAGDHGDFLQSFEVVSSMPDAEKSQMSLTIGGQTSNYAFGDFYPARNSGGEAQGRIVFAGAGISSPSQKHDDYAGLDVKGKIVVIVPAASAGIDLSKLGPTETGLAAARAHGAIGVLQIPQQRFAEQMKNKSFRERMTGRESVELAKSVDGNLPSAVMGPDLADKVLALAGLNLKDIYEAVHKKEAIAPKATEASARLVIAIRQTRVNTQNVAGILEGSDPQLKSEYVIFSAHYDHLKTDDTGIYPGADDDGSGTTAVLSIAHALAQGERPKRSILIIFHAGEELGLLGSEYNTDFAPAVPLDKIIVDLNIDMIGRSKPAGDDAKEDEHLTDAHTIYLVGADRISPELNQISEETNSEFQKLKLDYYYNDVNNPEHIYYRSDHWNYAKHGIPVIFYFDGVHVDYHKTTDTVDKIDFNKLTQVTRLVFETGWRLANMDHRLKLGSH